jgi:hypothetical protein
LRRNGVELDSLVLRDDGTNGDAIAGDRWFTLDGLVLPSSSGGLAAVSPNSVLLHEEGEAHGDESVFIAVAFRTADPAVLGSPPIAEIAPDARATSHVVSLVHSSARVIGENALPSIIRRYYDLFPDDRDFLVVLIPPTVRTGEIWGGTTDFNGTYAFVDVPPGNYTMTISGYPGYATFSPPSRNVTVVSGQELTVDFAGTYSGQ